MESIWVHVTAVLAIAALCGLWALGQRASGRGAERGGCGGGACLGRAVGTCDRTGTCQGDTVPDDKSPDSDPHES